MPQKLQHGSGQVLRTYTGRKTLPPSTSLPAMGEIADVNTASLGVYLHCTKVVRRQGPDGRKGSTMNSTAMCSTWRGMGSVRLYFACDSPCDDNKQPYHTGSVATRVNKDRAFRRTPGRRCQVCYWCIIEDSRKRQHHHWHLKHKDTKSCRETSGTNTRNDRYRWNILGLCEMRWKNVGETTTEEGHKVFFCGKEDKHEHGMSWDVAQSPAGSSPSA